MRVPVSYTHLSGTQLDKLDFLMQAMIKTSRLETGVISLEKKQQPIYDTLAMALGDVYKRQVQQGRGRVNLFEYGVW